MIEDIAFGFMAFACGIFILFVTICWIKDAVCEFVSNAKNSKEEKKQAKKEQMKNAVGQTANASLPSSQQTHIKTEECRDREPQKVGDDTKSDDFYSIETLEFLLSQLAVSLEADLSMQKLKEEKDSARSYTQSQSLESYPPADIGDVWKINSLFFTAEDKKRYIEAVYGPVAKRAIKEPIFFENIEIFNKVTPYQAYASTNSIKINEGDVHMYYTCLTKCTCPYYVKNGRVCKHMMALAMKVGAITLDVKEILNRR